MSCDQLPKYLPGQETRSPDDFELFLEGILEAPRGSRDVFPDCHYQPAFKNGPTASVYPCDLGTNGGAGSCNQGKCANGCNNGCNAAAENAKEQDIKVMNPAAPAPATTENPMGPTVPVKSTEMLPPVEGNNGTPTADGSGRLPGSAPVKDGKVNVAPTMVGSNGPDGLK
jgi:pilus assembly protein CpaC